MDESDRRGPEEVRVHRTTFTCSRAHHTPPFGHHDGGPRAGLLEATQAELALLCSASKPTRASSLPRRSGYFWADPDWIATGLFYAALHYIDAFLATQGPGHHPGKHDVPP